MKIDDWLKVAVIILLIVALIFVYQIGVSEGIHRMVYRKHHHIPQIARIKVVEILNIEIPKIEIVEVPIIKKIEYVVVHKERSTLFEELPFCYREIFIDDLKHPACKEWCNEEGKSKAGHDYGYLCFHNCRRDRIVCD